MLDPADEADEQLDAPPRSISPERIASISVSLSAKRWARAKDSCS